jgi:hypothetical protein
MRRREFIVGLRGNGFQAAEFVRLQITIKQGTNNPITVNQQTTADAARNVDFKYTGTGGGVCNAGEIASFQVQGSGLTSGKVSNVAQAGCF